jgi:copper chaperone CopZ
LSIAAASAALVCGAARAEVTATLSNVHLCCKGCSVAVEKSLEKLPAVKCETNQDEGTVKLTADTVDNLQKAVNRIGRAGLHGKLDTKEVKFRKLKLPEGKVQRLEVTGVHNCCPACTKAIKAALAKVEGVAGDSCEPKKDAFVIEGDFVAKDAIRALNKAGFHASLPKPKAKPKS